MTAPISSVPEGLDLRKVARRAGYVGGPQHKDEPSFAGRSAPVAGGLRVCKTPGGRTGPRERPNRGSPPVPARG